MLSRPWIRRIASAKIGATETTCTFGPSGLALPDMTYRSMEAVR